MAGALSPQHGSVVINGLERKSSVEAELRIRCQTVFLPDRPWLPKNRLPRSLVNIVLIATTPK